MNTYYRIEEKNGKFDVYVKAGIIDIDDQPPQEQILADGPTLHSTWATLAEAEHGANNFVTQNVPAEYLI